MSTETATLVAACIAAGAAIVAAVLTFFSVRKTNYTNAIVASRIKWIGELREDFSKLFAEAEYILENSSDEEALRTYREASLNLTLKLNPKDDSEIIALLAKLENAVTKASRNEDWENLDRGYLTPKIQALLKCEWDKAKNEANRFW